MNTILNNPKLAGFLRAIAYVVVAAVTAYLADPANLTFLSGSTALVVAGIFAVLDHAVQASNGTALFGLVK